MSHIILKCVREGSKIRVKFHTYVAEDGKRYSDAYNNNYNCRFRKDLREVGKYYKILPQDLKITNRGNSLPFYSVKSTNVQIVNVLDTINVYKVSECIICMTNNTNITITPCGHHCMCAECYEQMRHRTNMCPLCRVTIEQAIIN